jgi:hypothetical protein
MLLDVSSKGRGSWILDQNQQMWSELDVESGVGHVLSAVDVNEILEACVDMIRTGCPHSRR